MKWADSLCGLIITMYNLVTEIFEMHIQIFVNFVYLSKNKSIMNGTQIQVYVYTKKSETTVRNSGIPETTENSYYTI